MGYVSFREGNKLFNNFFSMGSEFGRSLKLPKVCAVFFAQDCVALICAAGEAKAQVVQHAVEDLMPIHKNDQGFGMFVLLEKLQVPENAY